MQAEFVGSAEPLNEHDREQLAELIDVLELSDRTRTVVMFAIAPESRPEHPVVEQLVSQLGSLDEQFQVYPPFRYGENTLYDFLQTLDDRATLPLGSGRRVIMAFGLEQLKLADFPRFVREMKQLNLGREEIFKRNLVLIFWLNREDFLDEFRNRTPDFWDWRRIVATFTTRPPLDRLLYPYLEWLIAENSYLKMSGVMQVNRQVDIFLDQIYVSLQAEWVEDRSQSFRERVTLGEGQVRSSRASLHKLGEPDALEVGFNDEPILLEVSAEPVSRHRVTKIVDLAEAVRKQDFSVILGDPGAGKTTLLRYLARHFAIAHRDGNSTVLGGMQEDLGQVRLPILFRIADYAERLAKQPDLSLVDYLKQFYRQWERYFEASNGDAVANLLLDKMAAGDCLLLLDGLDEVFDQSNRVQVVQQIDRLVNDYRTNKFVITSRIAGYQEAALGNRFREFTITPMGNAQIQQFLERWCLAIEVAQRPEADASLHQRDAEREARGILDAIETKPGVKRFAANPLLLTILALIHRNGTQMPQRRVELYALATKTLIEDWQLGRNAPYGARQRQLILVEEEVTALLAPLAFRMHEEKPSGLVTQAEVEEWLTPKMAELQGVDEPAALELVRQFLRKVRETTGLFVERAPAVYGFMHLTFEEYFAARHIADNEIDDILRIISPYRNQARWNEPILLALGYLSTDQKRVNRLVEQLFSNLADYQPMIAGQDIRLKNASADHPVLVWTSQPEGEVQESDSVWQDLLFVGQVLAEVKVTPKFCRQQVEKLVLTYLGLDKDFEEEPTQQLLKLLRGIETFNHQVLERLQQAAEDESLSEEQRSEALAAMLYVACGETGETLIDRITAIVQQLTPSLFDEIRDLVEELGAEMTPGIERSLEDTSLDVKRRQALEFMTGLSYLRAEQYDRAIARLQLLVKQVDCYLNGYIHWAIAIAYEEKDDYDQGLQYYQQCSEKLQSFILLRNWGVCHRSHKQYEQSLECFQQALAISTQLNNRKAEASILWNIGRSYQDWGKYEEAIAHYEQSRDLLQQLEQPKNVANQWDNLAACYREWDKYEQALNCQLNELTLHQKLGDRASVADTYFRLGRVYYEWGKYQQSIDYFQQSRDLSQKLERRNNVGWMWKWMGYAYKKWGKYNQAVECQHERLKICQNLDDQAEIAIAYYDLGRIYQAWGKYEQALAHHEQSRDLYHHLGKETNVANQWYSIGECYREWGKYQQALEAQQQLLTLRQKLDDQENIALAYYQLGRIYQDWGKYETALAHYRQSRDLYQRLGQETDVADLWYSIGECYREWGKYQQALEAQQQLLTLRQKLDDQGNIALAYYQLGRIYQAWDKYVEAIASYEQSRDLYQQLEQPKNVASRWYNLAECYREWSKYEQALECQQHCLEIRQTLDDPALIAVSHYQLGRIYQSWGKYAEAITSYEQSRDLYQQLERPKNVASRWYNLAECYREWSKYEQALECQQHCLEIRQTLLDDPALIAVSHYQLGRIYQAWGKYVEAIASYEQSRDLYQQLEQPKNVASLWNWLAECYREWSKYEQALECQQHCLEIRQTLLDDPALIAFSHYQLGRIYQAWGKYVEAIASYEQSRDLYQQLERPKDVTGLWYNLAECYREWSKYEQALEYAQGCLQLFESLQEQMGIAATHHQLGQIYQAWDKYAEAIAYHEQSCALYVTLDLQQKVANQLSWLAACDRESKDYTTAIEYYQNSFERYQALGHNESATRQLRQLSNTQRLLAKNCSREEATPLIQQAEHHLQQAIQLDTAGDYRENLAYDHIALALLSAESLRWLPEDDASVPDRIAQFEQSYTTGFAYLTELGQAVDSAEKALDIARAYLEISPLENLDRAEELAHQSLQTFQNFNRRQLEAAACKLLGEIYLARAHRQESGAIATASQFLNSSLHRYRELDLTEKAAEVEQLMSDEGIAIQ